MNIIIMCLNVLSIWFIIVSTIHLYFINEELKNPSTSNLIKLAESVGGNPVRDCIKKPCIKICLSFIWLISQTLI